MEKIKWKYDKMNQTWYVIESSPYANDGFDIFKTDGCYNLRPDRGEIRRFKKLSSAKTVANLLRHG